MRRPLIVGNSAGVSTIAPTRPITRPTWPGVAHVEQPAGAGGGPGQAEQAADRRGLPGAVRARGTRTPRRRGPPGRGRRRPRACGRRRGRYSLRSPAISITGVMGPACAAAVPRSLRLRCRPWFRCDRAAGGVQPPREVARGGGAEAQGWWSSVLGAPRIERDGAVVAFDTRKATALLGYLAVTARPQRRETLAALLWPDADETRARSALRRTLSVIRKELGDLGPTITRDEVELVDRRRGRDRRPGLPRRRRRRDDVDGGGARRRAVARRSAGRLQPPRQPRLRRVAVAGGRAAAAGDVRRRALDSSTPARRRASSTRPSPTPSDGCDLDPLHEPAHRALMRLHAQRGDRAAAVHQYRAVRAHGRRGARGGPARGDDGALRGHQRRGRSALPTRSHATPSRARDAVVGRYPLIGRDEELERLLAAIGPGRVVVVEGEPGVGKTRLVEEVARAPGPPGADGALLRQRRRRARTGRSSTCCGWPLADPATAEALGGAPVAGRDGGRPAGARSWRRPTADARRSTVRGPRPGSSTASPGPWRRPAARPRACSSSTTCSGRTTPPSRCWPTWCTGAETTGPAWSSPSAAARSATPARSSTRSADRLRDGAGVADPARAARRPSPSRSWWPARCPTDEAAQVTEEVIRGERGPAVPGRRLPRRPRRRTRPSRPTSVTCSAAAWPR